MHEASKDRSESPGCSSPTAGDICPPTEPLGSTAEYSEMQALAFRTLLQTGAPVTIADLADRSGGDLSEAEELVADLDRQGLIRRDDDGSVIGSVGLSVVPSHNEIHVGGRRFWTWCAKTSLGILGGAAAGGWVEAQCPASGRELRLDFDGASPQPDTGLAVFWPSEDLMTSCGSVVDNFCVNINFFETASAAETWQTTHQVPGEVLSVEDATARSAAKWRPLVAGLCP